MVTVFLKAALICFSGTCHHALVGARTPTGVFQMQQQLTTAQGYGGDVLAFAQSDHYLWAIHRVWLLSPTQHRAERLVNNDPTRRWITMGCINVEPMVYDALVACCSRSKLRIEP